MYPFERFTERAKKTLTLAQEEAERSHHSYIGTEHLLLGLLRNKEGLGYRVLGALGVRIEVVRETIESVLGRNERIIVRQIIPTSRVKKVIELSFEEAQRMGHEYVGTEHLLLGLMIEGEGVAAHVLSDLGVTLAKVRDEIERQLMGGVAPEAVSGPRAADHQHTGVGSYLENLEALLAETSVAQLWLPQPSAHPVTHPGRLSSASQTVLKTAFLVSTILRDRPPKIEIQALGSADVHSRLSMSERMAVSLAVKPRSRSVYGQATERLIATTASL